MPDNADDLLGMSPEDYAELQARLTRLSAQHERRSRAPRRGPRVAHRRRRRALAVAMASALTVGAVGLAVATAGQRNAGPSADDARLEALWDRLEQEVDLPVSPEARGWSTVDELGHPLALVTVPCGGSVRISFRSNPTGQLEFRSATLPDRWHLATDDELTDRLCGGA